MAYNINPNKLDLLIRAYGRDEEINEETAYTILGIKTKQVVRRYLKEFNDWKEGYEAEESELTEAELIEEPDEEEVTKNEETQEPPKPVKTPFAKKKKVEPKPQLPENKPIEDYTFVLEDENGAETLLDISFASSSTVVLKEVKPIIKEVRIGGNIVEVDLQKLRKMSPDAVHQGVKVSTLIVAAEIA